MRHLKRNIVATNKQTQESEAVPWDIPPSAVTSDLVLRKQDTHELSQQDTQPSVHCDESVRKEQCKIQNLSMSIDSGHLFIVLKPRGRSCRVISKERPKHAEANVRSSEHCKMSPVSHLFSC